MAPRDAGIYLFLGAEFDEIPNRNIEKISSVAECSQRGSFFIFCGKVHKSDLTYRSRAVSAHFFHKGNEKVVDYLTLNIEENEYRERKKTRTIGL